MDEHPGRPHNIVDGPEEMRKKVRELIRAGADVIKVCTSGGVISMRDDPQHAHFLADELDVLVAEATAAGRFVMAHAQATDGIKNAIRAGIRSIEHGIYLDDEAIQMMLDAGTYLVPTLIAPLGLLEAADRGIDLPAVILDKCRAVVDVSSPVDPQGHRRRRQHRDGDRFGRHATRPEPARTRSMAELGMSPTAVFESSTRVAAELMGVDSDLGTLESRQARRRRHVQWHRTRRQRSASPGRASVPSRRPRRLTLNERGCVLSKPRRGQQRSQHRCRPEVRSSGCPHRRKRVTAGP